MRFCELFPRENRVMLILFLCLSIVILLMYVGVHVRQPLDYLHIILLTSQTTNKQIKVICAMRYK